MSRILISFRVLHRDLVVEDVSNALGIIPSKAYGRNDEENTSRKVPLKTGAWILEEPCEGMSQLYESLKTLTGRFEHATDWLAKKVDEGYYVGILCSISPNSGDMTNMSYDHKLLESFAKISTNFDLTVTAS